MGCMSSRSAVAPSEISSTKKQQEQTQRQNTSNSSKLMTGNQLTSSQQTLNKVNSQESSATRKPNATGNSHSALSNELMDEENINTSSPPINERRPDTSSPNQRALDNSNNPPAGEQLAESGADKGGPKIASSIASASKIVVASTSQNEEESGDPQLDPRLLEEYLFVEYDIMHLEDKEPLRHYHEKIEQLENLESELDMISVEAKSRGDDISRNSVLMSRLQQRSTPTNQSIASVASKQTSVVVNNKAPLAYSGVEEIFNRKIILEKQRDKLKKEIELLILECDKLQQKYKKRDEILDELFDGQTGNGLENHLEQQLNWLLQQKHYVDQVFYAWKRAETLTSQSCEQLATALEQLRQLPKAVDDEQRRNLARSIKDLLQKSRQDLEDAQRYNPDVEAPFFNGSETQRFERVTQILEAMIDGGSSGEAAPQQSKGVNSKEVANLLQTEYSQLLSIMQFAYKRSTNIRLWLEQILQTTIARDSFELAEEYKWIAIQLRKERINLVKLALREPVHAKMVHAVRQKLFSRDQLQKADSRQQKSSTSQSRSKVGSSTNNTSRDKLPVGAEDLGGSRQSVVRASVDLNKQASDEPAQKQDARDKAQQQVATAAASSGSAHKLRDSGIESEPNNEADITEEIYRLLEMKSKASASETVDNSAGKAAPVSDDEMRQRIRRREEQARTPTGRQSKSPAAPESQQPPNNRTTPSTNTTPPDSNSWSSNAADLRLSSSLRVALDEDERKNLQSEYNLWLSLA